MDKNPQIKGFMHLQVYGDKIIAPNKHGTRYLNQIFNFEYDDYDQVELFEDYKRKWYKEGFFIYRDPLEHLISALQTEIISFCDTNKINDRVHYHNSIEMVISDFLSPRCTTHWHKNLLENLYKYWLNSNKNLFKVVELKNLSPLLIELGYEIPVFDPVNYDFRNSKFWLSKENTIQLIKKKFPNEWKELTSNIDREMIFYEKLKNQVVTDELPKIVGLSKIYELPKVKGLSKIYSKKIL